MEVLSLHKQSNEFATDNNDDIIADTVLSLNCTTSANGNDNEFMYCMSAMQILNKYRHKESGPSGKNQKDCGQKTFEYEGEANKHVESCNVSENKCVNSSNYTAHSTNCTPEFSETYKERESRRWNCCDNAQHKECTKANLADTNAVLLNDNGSRNCKTSLQTLTPDSLLPEEVIETAKTTTASAAVAAVTTVEPESRQCIETNSHVTRTKSKSYRNKTVEVKHNINMRSKGYDTEQKEVVGNDNIDNECKESDSVTHEEINLWDRVNAKIESRLREKAVENEKHANELKPRLPSADALHSVTFPFCLTELVQSVNSQTLQPIKEQCKDQKRWVSWLKTNFLGSCTSNKNVGLSVAEKHSWKRTSAAAKYTTNSIHADSNELPQSSSPSPSFSLQKSAHLSVLPLLQQEKCIIRALQHEQFNMASDLHSRLLHTIYFRLLHLNSYKTLSRYGNKSCTSKEANEVVTQSDDKCRNNNNHSDTSNIANSNNDNNKSLFLLFESTRGSSDKQVRKLECVMESIEWELIGFQGSNPATDLRNTGMLGLLHVLFLLENCPEFTGRLWQTCNPLNVSTTSLLPMESSRHTESAEHTSRCVYENGISHDLPFVLVLFNITALVLDVLNKGRCSFVNKQVKRRVSELVTAEMQSVYDTYPLLVTLC